MNIPSLRQLILFMMHSRKGESNSPDHRTPQDCGAEFMVKINESNAQIITFTVEGKDIDGDYYTVASFNYNKERDGLPFTIRRTVYPSISGEVLPRIWRFSADTAGESATWSAGATLIPCWLRTDDESVLDL